MSFSNSHLIIEKNMNTYTPKRIPIIKGEIEFRNHQKELNFLTIKTLLRFVSSVRNKYHSGCLHLFLNFGNVTSTDKLTIQILECVVYTLIHDYRYKITIDITMENTIDTECFRVSPLRYLGKGKRDINAFYSAFENSTSIKTYRRVVPKSWSYGEELGGLLYSDIKDTVNHTIDDEEFSELMAEVVTELVNNANEHNQSDCLIDVDVSNNYMKRGDTENVFLGVNMSLVSFSDVLVPDLLSTKIKSGEHGGNRYDTVTKAYRNHQAFFNDGYTEDDFFIVTAYQDYISGRKGRSPSGGTGLTKVIQTLEKYSDSSKCYMVTGKNALYFFHDYLDYDSNGYVGFNDEKDYLNYPPDKKTRAESPIYIPGIAYNLSFVYRKDDK